MRATQLRGHERIEMLQARSQGGAIRTERPGAKCLIAKNEQAEPIAVVLLDKGQGGLLDEIESP